MSVMGVGGTTATGDLRRPRHDSPRPVARAAATNRKSRAAAHLQPGSHEQLKPLNREEPYPMTNETSPNDLERDYGLEDAGLELARQARPMGSDAVKVAAHLLSLLDRRDVVLTELVEHSSRRGGIHWRAAIGHAIYRPATVQQYRDLTQILRYAGYASAPYGDYTTYGMTNPDGSRGRCSVVLVKPVNA